MPKFDITLKRTTISTMTLHDCEGETDLAAEAAVLAQLRARDCDAGWIATMAGQEWEREDDTIVISNVERSHAIRSGTI